MLGFVLGKLRSLWQLIFGGPQLIMSAFTIELPEFKLPEFHFPPLKIDLDCSSLSSYSQISEHIGGQKLDKEHLAQLLDLDGREQLRQMKDKPHFPIDTLKHREFNLAEQPYPPESNGFVLK